MAHNHIHNLSDGRKTGNSVFESGEESLHWHLVDGEKTSTTALGEGHTHTFEGEETSGPIVPEASDKGVASKMEVKYFGGKIVEAKEETRNGILVGLIKGYIATWDLDRGDDLFVRGAFLDSLSDHRMNKNRPIRFKNHHRDLVGGFPIDGVMEDERGLLGTAEVNLELQQGREIFALAKQGVLSDFSIGFSVVNERFEDGTRIIEKAIIWEGSIVDEPMNVRANVIEVKQIKTVVSFKDFPLADRKRDWDKDAAISRIKEFTDSEENPSERYKQAFVWFDSKDAKEFDAYKLPIADVVNGRLVAVPKGIFAAAGALQGARGGVDIPDEDRPKAIKHIERYYAKMDLESPFTGDDKQYFVADDIKKWTPRDLEKFLKSSGSMSNNAAKMLASRINKEEKKEPAAANQADWTAVLNNIKSIKL